MARRMSFPKRSDSAVPQFRMRTPRDIFPKVAGRRMVISLPDVGKESPRAVEVTIGKEISFSLRTRDPAVAEAWTRAARAQVERFFAAIESGPTKLSQKQLVALSGAIYRLYVEAHSENPGDPERWAAFKAFNRAAAEGRILASPALAVGDPGDDEAAFARFGEDLTAGIDALPVSSSTDALEQRFGALANWVLTREGIDIDAETRLLLLRQIAVASLDAGWALKRAASGDYTPDPKALRFPKIEVSGKREAIGFEDIWKRWVAEKSPAPATKQNYRSVFDKIKPILGDGYDDLRLLDKKSMVDLKDKLVDSGLAPKTINDAYLSPIRAFLNIAAERGDIPFNPMGKLRHDVKRKAGTKMLPYTDRDVGRLLYLAQSEKLAAKRWLPLLAVTTGARIGELAQLWGQRVHQEDGVWVIRIAPSEDGGTLKNEVSERTVPLHPVVIASGFLEFAKSRGGGPLFYKAPKVAKKPEGEGRHTSKGVSNHLSSWIREIGFNDPRKAPNHASRHWWKTAASKVGIADSVADHLQGHKTPGVAAGYRHQNDLLHLAEVVARIPIPSPSPDV